MSDRHHLRYGQDKFGARDPRRLDFRRVWSSGNDNVGNVRYAGISRLCVEQCNGRAIGRDLIIDDLIELVETRDLQRQFDPDIPADSGRCQCVSGVLLIVKTGYMNVAISRVVGSEPCVSREGMYYRRMPVEQIEFALFGYCWK